ncbi:hypothetical protein HPHPP8B_0744 [Helicobacter pylori Hp P-8b]|uniref:hypothetical protein n=1 Tax=Helicobacter pylori TaxID=210 RepID=UPI00026B3673|nr:hypothetical protein [Helicobacter pylori]EJC28187.1 hypothetical protein HPHPP8B_0744 [Helicobacter pylori Hp P-8b]
MENTDNWKSFFSKLKLVGSIELLMIYLKNEGYIVSSDPKKNNNTDLFAPKIFYYESIAPKTKKIFIVKNSLLDSGLLSIFFNKDSSYNINPNLKNYLKDSRYPKNFSYAFHLFFTSNDNNLSVHIGCECVNIDFKLTEFDRDDKKYYNRIVFEFKYDLNEEDKQYLIEFVPIKYNNNLSYSPKEENQFKKKGLTPLILKAFEHNHIKVKHREKELEILFFENKQELYNSINKP